MKAAKTQGLRATAIGSGSSRDSAGANEKPQNVDGHAGTKELAGFSLKRGRRHLAGPPGPARKRPGRDSTRRGWGRELERKGWELQLDDTV